MNLDELQSCVLQHVNQSSYKPAKPRDIAKQLNLSKDQVADVKKAVKRLVKAGQLSYGSNHLVKSAGVRGNEIVGVFQRKTGGFGFVRPSGIPRSASRDQDVYVPAGRSKDASSGDTVRVRLGRSRRGRENRISGEVQEIIERGTHQFVGTYYEEGGQGFVRVDAGVFGEAVSVGDPGAKNAQPDDKVVIEMVHFPTHYRPGEGVITDVLGPRGAPGVDTQMIIREFGLPQDFPEDALEDARQRAEEFDEVIGDGRVDLTWTTVVTIDPVDARDFDDAISLEQLDNGHWRLGVHIADVSHFVRLNSPLDREARERATSIYLPDRVIPMLPEIISNNLASLQPDRIRYTKTAFIEFTSDGALVDTDFCSAAIKSDRRFTYEEVDDYLARPVQWKEKLSAEVFGLVDRMYRLAMILRRRRMERGAIELDLPEIKLKLDKDGRVAGAYQVEHTESHQVIEEFMLAANEAVARKLTDIELLFLRRVHESPDPRKLKALTEFIHELGIPAESLESRFEIKRVLAEVADKPEEHAVNFAVLRSFPKAVYGPQQEGHFALASDCYCHFTSPIRRYPDLTVHRLLESIFRGKKAVQDFDRLANLGQHCSDREQRAEQAERELTKLKLLNYLSKKLGQSMEVVVTGVEQFGLFAMGVDLPAEGLIHVTSLQDDFYHYDARSRTLMGRRADHQFRLGDLLLVEIAHIDLDKRELDFRLIKRLEHRAAPSGAARKKKRSGTKTTARGKKKKAAKAKKKTTTTSTRKKSRRKKT